MRLVRLGLAIVFTMSCASTASAQLLPSMQQVVSCTTSRAGLTTSPKLDAALQKWARDGGSGRGRIIVSAQGGLLGTVQTLLSTLGGTLFGNLPGIYAVVGEVNATIWGTAGQPHNTVWGNLAEAQ
jgi:hypothetical protein